MTGRALNLILTHQRAPQVGAMLRWWAHELPDAAILLAVNHGPEIGDGEFDAIAHPDKVRVNDPRLRTRDHPRGRQSYSAVFAATAAWLAARPEFGFVHFAEFDHLPLVADFNARQHALLEREEADVLGFAVRRVDGTSQSIWLSHVTDAPLRQFFRTESVRADPSVVLSMFGSGSFWTRGAFLAVAAVAEPCPVYLELWLPTLAHHLGFRVRGYGDGAASSYIKNLGDRVSEIHGARAAGAWSIHPVKTLWNQPGKTA